MEIGSGFSVSYSPVKPQPPREPQAPPGGNVENRQPPQEPSPPPARAASGRGTGTLLDITV